MSVLRKNMQRVSSWLLQRSASISHGGSQSIRKYSSSPVVEQRLAGQVALITGGASGIGAATARMFTRHGARVVIADIQPGLGKKLVEELGSQAEYVECDVRREGDIENAVNKALSMENRLDIFHSNAGIIGEVGPINELRVDEYDATIAVNLRAAVIGVKHAARAMKPRRNGSIIVTGSVAGLQGGMGPHGYTISKAGLIGLVKSASVELGQYSIRINMISPELVSTPLSAFAMAALGEGGGHSVSVSDIDKIVEEGTMLPGRLLTDIDIANAALFLASDIGGYINGHNLVIDGGMTVAKLLDSAGNTWFKKYMPMIAENGRRGL